MNELVLNPTSVNFLEANTNAITIEELTEQCVVPTWANQELTISHQDFISTVHDAACNVFAGETINNPEIRVPFAIQIHPFGRKNVFSATHQYTAHALCLKAERCGCRKVSVYSRSFHLDTLHPFSFLRMVGKVFQVGNVVGRCR